MSSDKPIRKEPYLLHPSDEPGYWLIVSPDFAGETTGQTYGTIRTLGANNRATEHPFAAYVLTANDEHLVGRFDTLREAAEMAFSIHKAIV